MALLCVLKSDSLVQYLFLIPVRCSGPCLQPLVVRCKPEWKRFTPDHIAIGGRQHSKTWCQSSKVAEQYISQAYTCREWCSNHLFCDYTGCISKHSSSTVTSYYVPNAVITWLCNCVTSSQRLSKLSTHYICMLGDRVASKIELVKTLELVPSQPLSVSSQPCSNALIP